MRLYDVINHFISYFFKRILHTCTRICIEYVLEEYHNMQTTKSLKQIRNNPKFDMKRSGAKY